MRFARTRLCALAALVTLALLAGSAGADLMVTSTQTRTVATDLTATGWTYIGGTLDYAGSSSTLRVQRGLVDLTEMGPGSVINGQAGRFWAEPETLVLVSPGFDPGIFGGGFTVEGLLHTIGSPLTIPAGRTIRGRSGYENTPAGQGVVRDHLIVAGRLEADFAGLWNLAGGLQVVPGGYVKLFSGTSGSAGRASINNTISGISGGELFVTDLFLGTSANARFVQTGGTVTPMGYFGPTAEIAAGVVVGHGPGLEGTYELHSGVLATDAAYTRRAATIVGWAGDGTFRQTGGQHRPFALRIGSYRPDNDAIRGNGQYLMAGGGMEAFFVDVGTQAGGGTGRLRLESPDAQFRVKQEMRVYPTGLLEGVAGASLYLEGATLRLEAQPQAWADLAAMRLVFLPPLDPVDTIRNPNVLDNRLASLGDEGPNAALIGQPGSFGTIQLGEPGHTNTSLTLFGAYVDTLVLYAGTTLNLQGPVYYRTLEDYGATINYLSDSAKLVVVPEPATLALLALGAALLRRRR